MPCAKGSCLHLGLLGPTATQIKKHYKTLIFYKYKKVHPSLDWKVPAPITCLNISYFCSFLHCSEDVSPRGAATEHISWHLNRFINSLTSDLVFLSTAQMSSNSLINTPVSGRLNCLAS